MPDFDPAVFDDPRFKVCFGEFRTSENPLQSRYGISVREVGKAESWNNEVIFTGVLTEAYRKHIEYALMESVWRGMKAKGLFDA